MTEISREAKIANMRRASNIVGIGFQEYHVEVLLDIYEAICERGGDVSLRDIAMIEEQAKKADELRKQADTKKSAYKEESNSEQPNQTTEIAD